MKLSAKTKQGLINGGYNPQYNGKMKLPVEAKQGLINRRRRYLYLQYGGYLFLLIYFPVIYYIIIGFEDIQYPIIMSIIFCVALFTFIFNVLRKIAIFKQLRKLEKNNSTKANEFLNLMRKF